MDLNPKFPPGRASRKALAFSAEIQRLRNAGYSFEAIRIALCDAGVNVSGTTVKREAARRTAPAAILRQLPASSAPLAQQSSPLAPASLVGEPRTGREIAEAFMRGRISNLLVRERMEDEALGD